MIQIDGHTLDLATLEKVARRADKVSISAKAIENIQRSRQRLEAIISAGKPVYGLNTGYGIFADRTISQEESRKLNRNLILSHAVGTGESLPEEVVRAAMLIRANTLSKGFSGVSLQLIQTLLEMLNRGVIPQVYSKGSLGSSGDLCMLAQMVLVLSQAEGNEADHRGKACVKEQILKGDLAMAQAGIKPLVLSGKDGLALINGATFSAAMLALCVIDAQYLSFLANLAATLSFEALLARTDALHPQLHLARGLHGQIDSAELINKILQGSTLVNSHKQVQDAYSLRCAPQVHGAAQDTIDFVKGQVELEINAATDNPLIVEDGLAVSGGNFHGEAIGMAADFLSIALAELAGISERRVFRLLDANLNHGLPPMLVGDGNKAGLNSGIMMLQYTAAALVLENQTLCGPDSVRSLPTSANQEDFNANAWNAALHCAQIIENTRRVIICELYTACRALDMRLSQHRDLKPGQWSGRVYEFIRERIPFHSADTYWKEEVDALYDLVFPGDELRQALSQVLTTPLKQGID